MKIAWDISKAVCNIVASKNPTTGTMRNRSMQEPKNFNKKNGEGQMAAKTLSVGSSRTETGKFMYFCDKF